MQQYIKTKVHLAQDPGFWQLSSRRGSLGKNAKPPGQKHNDTQSNLILQWPTTHRGEKQHICVKYIFSFET